MGAQPVAFMSYSHFDDERGHQFLTQLRKELSDEVKQYTGETFDIFQDKTDIGWGQNWKQRIEESLDEATFLIPILTPMYFKSGPCRDELARFLEREKELQRNDLILAVYYIDSPLINDPDQRAQDSLALNVVAHQWEDWRQLRYDSFDAREVRQALTRMAIQIRDALDRVQATQKELPPSEDGNNEAIPVDLGLTTIEPQLTPLKEPPTHVVDAWQRGDFAAISQAIKAAQPGDRIRVQPGLYSEGLVIDKPLEIVGIGDRQDIVLQATGEAVVFFQANIGSIANLTLRQMGGGGWYAVDIAYGRLQLENCDITSRSRSCIAIRGRADPRLRGNQIHDSNGDGVHFYNEALGALEDNDIFGNMGYGVEISDNSDPVLRGNRIYDNGRAGVAICQQGKGTVEDNEIYCNKYSGVRIEKGGKPTVRHNRINRNRGFAIRVKEGGRGVIENNDLENNDDGKWNLEEHIETRRADN